jgi:DNA-directed RNA polymerase subunit RPC12/RpoP
VNVSRKCPSCGRDVDTATNEVSGANFCPHCDEPLFWRPSKSPETAMLVEPPATNGGAPTQDGRRVYTHDRLPETEGIDTGVYEECWNCKERNEPPSSGTVIVCRVCNATIPKPKDPTPELGVESSCTSRQGETARRPWEVPDKLLVAVGVVLVALMVVLVVALIW